MVTFPNCKINIGLFITSRRDDGYHNIMSVLYPAGWRDVLEIVPSDSAQSSLTITGRRVDCPVESNLVMKACRAVAERHPIPPVDIYLRKIIPDGAGLGGGSSDAAFTITTLNKLFNIGMTDEQMAEIASTIGADCPFFIYNRPMLVTGTGTTLSPIDLNLEGYRIAIVKPREYVSTAEAYRGCTPLPAPIDLAGAICHSDPSGWSDVGVANDFERSVLPLHPAISDVKERLNELGAIYAAMSGSGASVFALFSKETNNLGDILSDAFPNHDTFAGCL